MWRYWFTRNRAGGLLPVKPGFANLDAPAQGNRFFLEFEAAIDGVGASFTVSPRPGGPSTTKVEYDDPGDRENRFCRIGGYADLLAFDRGEVGERCILDMENPGLAEISRIVARIVGGKATILPIPHDLIFHFDREEAPRYAAPTTPFMSPRGDVRANLPGVVTTRKSQLAESEKINFRPNPRARERRRSRDNSLPPCLIAGVGPRVGRMPVEFRLSRRWMPAIDPAGDVAADLGTGIAVTQRGPAFMTSAEHAGDNRGLPSTAFLRGVNLRDFQLVFAKANTNTSYQHQLEQSDILS